MSARLFRVVAPVHDIEAATRFYAAVLGRPGRRVSPGRHYFDCGGTMLACVDAGAEGDGGTFRPNPEHLYFAVADVEAIHAACAREAARFPDELVHGAPAAEIVLRPWGERSFYVFDPSGNRLCFVDERTLFTGA